MGPWRALHTQLRVHAVCVIPKEMAELAAERAVRGNEGRNLPSLDTKSRSIEEP